MKKLITFLIFQIAIFTSSIVNASALDGAWKWEAGGGSVGTMEVRGNSGTFNSNNKTDTVKVLGTANVGKHKKIKFARSGGYSQTYIVWVAADRELMAGYFYNNNNPSSQVPFFAIKR